MTNNNVQISAKSQTTSSKLNVRIWNLFGIWLLFFGILALPAGAQAATLYAGSATQVVYEGQTFLIDWYLDTESSSINSVDLKLNFTPEILEIVEAGAGNSIVSLWIKSPVFDNQAGTVELTGGVPNGFQGTNVPIFRTTFRAKNTGLARVTLDAVSTILKNDGRGSSDNLKFKTLEFAVVDDSLLPSVIASSSHPDQNSWYAERDVKITFNAQPGTEYSYTFSSNLEIFPDEIKEEKLGSVDYPNMPDGIYYFKLNSKVDDSTWQEAGVYRVQIDSSPPEKFSLEIGSDPSVFGGKDFLSFSTVDKTSGISHYNIKLGQYGFWQEAASPYEIKKPWVGNTISVEAVDTAGNKRIETIEYKGWVPVGMLWSVLLLIVLAGIYWLSKLKLKK